MKKLLIVLFFTVLFLSACNYLSNCHDCDGKGYQIKIFGEDTIIVSCPACNGTGKTH